MRGICPFCVSSQKKKSIIFFLPSVAIEFSLPEAGFTELLIYNVMGQKIRELVSEYETPGIHSVVWNGYDDSGMPVSTGVYAIQLKQGGSGVNGSMMLIK